MRERPEPAPVHPWPFEGNELHLLPGVSDLSLGEPALCASLYNQGCRRRPVRQNVLQKDFWVFSECGKFQSGKSLRAAVAENSATAATRRRIWTRPIAAAVRRSAFRSPAARRIVRKDSPRSISKRATAGPWAPPDSSRRYPDVVPGHGQPADQFNSNGNTTESMGIAKPMLRPLPTALARCHPRPPTGGEAGQATPHARILPQEVRNPYEPKSSCNLRM